MVVESKFIKVDGYNIHYLSAGTGPPTILIHGGNRSSVDWIQNIEPLSHNFKVIAVDLLGHGQSDKPKVNYSLSYYADSINKILDLMKLKKIHIIGNSLGGAIALKFSLKFHEKVEKLVVVD